MYMSSHAYMNLLTFLPPFKATFTDFYQITMMYAYWKANKHTANAVFDAYFRQCPFEGEFAVLAGVSEVVKFINALKFDAAQLEYLR